MKRSRGTPGYSRLTSWLILLFVIGVHAVALGSGEVAYRVNDQTLTYELQQLGRHVTIEPAASWLLKPGAMKTPFVALMDADLGTPARTQFSGSVRCLRGSTVTLEQLPREARPGGEAQYMFFPKNKPTDISFRMVGSRKWLVSTKFDDESKMIVTNQVYWALEKRLLITFNVNFSKNAPRQANWRRKRVDTLYQLVSAFRMSQQ
jgi:hypothetical protein